MLRFIFDAVRYRCAYIDLDGCILRRMRVKDDARYIHFMSTQPGTNFHPMVWWRENLTVRPLIKRRLPLLYLLRYVFRVKLHIWTNRDFWLHGQVTIQSLGKHHRLFSGWQFHNGTKIQTRVPGPVMDDQKNYLACGKGRGLLVSQL